ncbi:MAG: cell surface protein SprA [Salibacteraceae bacterium]|nr:cell surface protein SprA [Salibacteraceae bacterium]MDP4845106.1 cell surface protein SprA [Salibacteraceae bacterium]
MIYRIHRILLVIGASLLMPFLLYSQDENAAGGGDSNALKFPFKDSYDALQEDDRSLYGKPPTNLNTQFDYDPATGQYNYSQKLGDMNYRPPSFMSFYEYQQYQKEKAKKEYWQQLRNEADYESEDGSSASSSSSFRPSLNVESEGFDRIFGGNTIEIRPNGSAELIFGVNSSKTENPAIPVNQRRITVFDFRENIQVNVIGNIGDKLKIQTNYNTQATFDFENQMKLEYTGYEDEIIQKIELGNVSLPLQSSLITGSQALFGVKSELKFGRLTVTSVYTQQKSERREVNTAGGAQQVEFELGADDYEANKHYFLSHFFRDKYEPGLKNPPIISTGLNITRVEVWVTNTNFTTEQTRNVIAFQDLGEPSRVYNGAFAGALAGGAASNGANQVYNKIYNNNTIRAFSRASQELEGPSFNLKSRFDYQKVELARKLEQGRDYTFNTQLGYLSMVQELQPNQVLAVAFEYTYNGQSYKVGEFSNENTGTDALILKMLKSTELNTRFPLWDLQMKNVYAIGAYQLQASNFELGVWYLDKEKGIDINYLPIPEKGFNDRPLLQVVALDRINNNSAAVPDGVFDFLASPQITVNPSNGRIFFPVLEPFGDYLIGEIRRITNGNEEYVAKYAFDSLYSNTQANAQYNFPNINRFSLKGKYESSNSSEIRLNAFNVPEGSVTVTAGGQTLVEGQDYNVNYTIGVVNIINQGLLESGTPIKVSLESNSAFGINRKALFASRFDYKISDNLNFGGTFMNLSERPLTQKVNFGDEPINNTVIGVDGNYSQESQFLTTLVDRIPLIDTKAKSSFTLSGEAAKLFPGHARAVGKDGNSYIDDFEGSQSTIDLRSFTMWSIASTPQGQPDLFPEGASSTYSNTLAFNKNRARFAWYIIDPLFFRDDNTTPDNVRGNPDIQENHFQRLVQETEVFPNKNFSTGTALNQFQVSMFDLSFYPEEPGPYNYDLDAVPGVTAGLARDSIRLENPQSRWGGIQRRIDQTDFDAANIEFIQFWMMDPYAESGTPGFPTEENSGALYFNIGNISEDVLKDEVKSFENGFPNNAQDAVYDPTDSSSYSIWGRLPTGQQIVNAFDNDPETRQFQDVGLEGLSDANERAFFKEYVEGVSNRYSGNPALAEFIADPSHDNYNFYRDDRYDSLNLNILERYKKYNGLEGNSPSAEQSASLNKAGYPTSASTIPDAEDINRDNTLDNVENYYQYKIDINEQQLATVGRNYINNILEPTTEGGARWYQFKIPIREFEKRVGTVTDFRSIRFMRMFVKGFEDPIFLRFARLELVRGEWRRYTGDLDQPGEVTGDDPNIQFNIGAVNIEENASKTPVNYVLPPQLQREIQAGSPNLARQNEQSLALQIQGLEDGKAQAAFRNVSLDMRSFKKLQMFVHAESMEGCNPVDDDDLRFFIRVGTDFTENYYEYEAPMSITPSGFYSNNASADQQTVWPLDNNIVIDFEDLFRAKRERNEQLGGDSDVQLNQRYVTSAEAGRKIVVVGNPNLADVRVVMIGVRNPTQVIGDSRDDGMPKCVEVWANELRLTHFDQTGGEAAIGRVSAQLADFASVTASGSISTPGWGALESKVSERQRETLSAVDASAQVQLDKFVPEEVGLKLPMYVGYSKNTSKPQFAPAQPDTPMDIYLNNRTPEERDSLKDISNTITERKSINFTNVRKEKTGDGKAQFYDISNFSGTYAYNEITYSDYNTQFNRQKSYRGGLAYSFSTSPKSIEPLKNVKFLKKSKYFSLIRDFNFTLMPKTFAVRTDLDRKYNERQIRNLSEATLPLPPFVDKSFQWNRVYNLSYDLTKALKIDFSANNRALIREFEGESINKTGGPDGKGSGGYYEDPNGVLIESYQAHKDSIMSSLKRLGMTTNYNHNTAVSYALPLSKIPILDWTNVTTRYTATYDWQRGPLLEDGVKDTLGNTVSNGQQLQLNATLNMLSLYNKVPYLKKVNKGPSKTSKKKAISAKGRPGVEAAADDKDDKKKKEEKDRKALDAVLRTLMAVKNVSGTYSLNRATTLPGYQRETSVLGLSEQLNEEMLGFVFGQQRFNVNGAETHFADYASSKNWFITSGAVKNPFLQTYSEQINLRASVQPLKDFRIDLTANLSDARNYSEFWNYDSISNIYGSKNTLLETGNFSSSIFSLGTAFANSEDLYQAFRENRKVVSQRLGNEIGSTAYDDEGYIEGYDGSQQDVLIPSFIAAYTGKSANKVGLNPLKSIPIPNWRINYTGLNKIPFFQKYFRTLSINHAYRSTYTVGGYQKSIAQEDTFNLSSRISPEYVIGQVSIQEQFSPLINIDMTWKNSLLTRIEVRKDRNLTLSTTNGQITEIKNLEFVLGSGYTVKQLKLPFTLQGQTLKSDFTLRADFSVRNSETQIVKIVENERTATAGQLVYSLKVTGDYLLTKALTLRLFYDWVSNTPKISNSFPTSNVNAGFSLRFSLAG